MQTPDKVEGLHNCREFSQRLECLYQTQEKSFLLFLKNKCAIEKTQNFLYGLVMVTGLSGVQFGL